MWFTTVSLLQDKQAAKTNSNDKMLFEEPLSAEEAKYAAEQLELDIRLLEEMGSKNTGVLFDIMEKLKLVASGVHIVGISK